MPTFTWDHIHLRTPDPEGTAQWFERMFGAEVIRTTQQGKSRVDIKLGGAMIFTAQVTPGDGVNAAPTTPYQGLDHFGLAVSGIDAIAADLRKKASSSPRNRTPRAPASRSAFCGDRRGFRLNCSTAIRNIPDSPDLFMPLRAFLSLHGNTGSPDGGCLPLHRR